MTNFNLIFCATLALNVAITFRSSDCWKKHITGNVTSKGDDNAAATGDDDDDNKEEQELKKTWRKVLNRYLIVYLLATLSDWCQGAYVYQLYSDYGYTQHDIAVLFVAGFGSSMIFGTFIGGMADRGGRRSFVVLYCLVYGASCVTKHFKSFQMLMLGRLLGGIAYSLLFSIFDAWLIGAHTEHGIKSYLSKSFSMAAYGNSVAAIIAGLVSHKAASSTDMTPIHKDTIYLGGSISPFDIALVGLLLCGIFALTLWEENYGEDTNKHVTDQGAKWYEGWKSACLTTVRSPDILLCGMISSLFEGSMYIFVFMWTPSLTSAAGDSHQDLPLGLIFSTFMICCMAGSSLFSIQIEHYKVEQIAVFVFMTAAISMAATAMVTDLTFKFLAMNCFELVIGMYFPIINTMKSMIVPDSNRVAIYNLYRVPLNFIVLFSLLTDLTPTQSFHLNVGMLAAATVLMFVLMKRREKNGVIDDESLRRRQDEIAVSLIAPELELEKQESWDF